MRTAAAVVELTGGGVIESMASYDTVAMPVITRF